MIVCKNCGYAGAYEGKRCPTCGKPYSLTESEVAELLESARRAKENKEMETVTENYRMLSDFGIPEAQREYGRILEREGEYRRALALYRPAAEAGDGPAAYRIAVRNVELNDDIRRFWLSYAAILGCKESFCTTADALAQSGEEHAADYFYRHAAACDDVGAIVTLARRYAEGVGCEKNEGYAKWFMDKLTLPPIHAIRLAYHLRNVKAVEPPIPVCDFYDEFLNGLAAEAERFGFLGARLFLVELLAERGDVRALMTLAHLYLEGIGTPVQVERALGALQTAAVSGSKEAYRTLGDLYFVGHAVEKDEKRALAYYEDGIALGDEGCMLRVGKVYLDGECVEQDIVRAIALFEEGERLGDAECARYGAMLKDRREQAYRMGMDARRKNPKDAYRLFSISASMGYTPAETRLGDCYMFGLGVERDRARGYRWYESAVRAGEEDALYPLGLCYARGVGVAFHYRRAIAVLRLAAQRGSEEAAEEIVRLQKRRLKKEIRSLFSRAMRLLYQHKYAPALELLTLLSRMDEAEAVYYLGACYEFGIGVDADRTQAFTHYGRAADLGFVDARSYHKTIFLKMIR